MSEVKVLLESLGSGTLESNSYCKYFFSAISLLAYRDPDKAKPYWEKLGYRWTFYEEEGAQCYLLENDNHIIVAFRGTEPKEFSDIKADLKFLKTYHRGEGKVHRGFMIEVWKLADSLTKHIYQTSKQVYITGHSLGGAMATLYSTFCRPQRPPIVYTYGAPRAGNIEYCTKYPNELYRVVNNNDMVPTVPPSLVGYRHVGEVVYINHYGNVRNLTPWQKFKDKWRGHMAAWRKLEFFDSIRDHSIDKYCWAMYNNWKKDGSNT